MLVLRFSHVFFGALWVGMMAFQTFFLMPALAEVGPDSGKFMAAPPHLPPPPRPLRRPFARAPRQGVAG